MSKKKKETLETVTPSNTPVIVEQEQHWYWNSGEIGPLIINLDSVDFAVPVQDKPLLYQVRTGGEDLYFKFDTMPTRNEFIRSLRAALRARYQYRMSELSLIVKYSQLLDEDDESSWHKP